MIDNLAEVLIDSKGDGHLHKGNNTNTLRLAPAQTVFLRLLEKLCGCKYVLRYDQNAFVVDRYLWP